jgi:hypothetical protein
MEANMKKKAPARYPSLTAPATAQAAPDPIAVQQPNARSPRMRDLADQVVLYLNPAGHKELKRFALGADRKVHDLLIEALEEWATKRGIRERMRVR